MPRWLWVATGTSLEDLVDLGGVVAAAARRSRAPEATSSCAQGQAVMPWAWTPVRVRVPWAEATAVPNSV